MPDQLTCQRCGSPVSLAASPMEGMQRLGCRACNPCIPTSPEPPAQPMFMPRGHGRTPAQELDERVYGGTFKP